jgi:activator of 2-hydroxyglutaryl-CoA dehydratase
VSKRHPEAASVVELGGEDAKVVLFRKEPRTGVVKKWAWMNDKCAGGTGAVIDKVSAKLGIRPEQLGQIRYGGVSIHPVAGKCGVFAETDITGLQKQGVPSEALMASLFDAIVRQDLAGLAHGYTLRPVVLLLGGPHVFLPGLRECWRHHLARLWEDRRIPISKDRSPEELAYVPEDALFFAALGAVEFGKEEIDENPTAGVYQGVDRLRWYVDTGRFEQRRPRALGRGAWIGSPKLATDETELRLFREQYGAPRWTTRRYRAGSVMEVFLGVDAGSTSTKAAALDTGGNVIAKSYQLSRGNPIEDAKHVVASLDQQIREQGAEPRVLSVATTGYAKDLLKEVIGADLALVETVAHMRSGLHQHPDADVICDVGGQDIKILLLKNGVVTDFRLNTQCSAGNGYYLQATAAAFGYRVEDYADVAFAATAMPEFGCGCAVFLQSDIVGFQRQGWQPNEILAGLAAV